MSVSEFSDTSRKSRSCDNSCDNSDNSCDSGNNSDHHSRDNNHHSRDHESWDCDEHSDHKHCNDRCRKYKRCGIKHSNTPVGVWNLLYYYDTNLPMNNTTSSIVGGSTTMNNCNTNCRSTDHTNCHSMNYNNMNYNNMNNTTYNNMNQTMNQTMNNTMNMNQTMNLERPSQLLLNAGGTFINAATPDLNNNPFGALLSLGMGVWREMGNRKLRLDESHIAYRASNGAPTVYYRVQIIMKLSRSGTKARFHGRAIPKNLDDPTLCSDTDGTTFCFSGHGYKVLEPHY